MTINRLTVIGMLFIGGSTYTWHVLTGFCQIFKRLACSFVSNNTACFEPDGNRGTRITTGLIVLFNSSYWFREQIGGWSRKRFLSMHTYYWQASFQLFLTAGYLKSDRRLASATSPQRAIYHKHLNHSFNEIHFLLSVSHWMSVSFPFLFEYMCKQSYTQYNRSTDSVT